MPQIWHPLGCDSHWDFNYYFKLFAIYKEYLATELAKSTTVGQCWTAGQPLSRSKGQIPLQGLKQLRQLAIYFYFLKKKKEKKKKGTKIVSVSTWQLQALFTVVSFEQKKFVNK